MTACAKALSVRDASSVHGVQRTKCGATLGVIATHVVAVAVGAPVAAEADADIDVVVDARAAALTSALDVAVV